MKSKEYDPLRLDVAAFAAAGASLSGDWPVTSLSRIAGSASADAAPAAGDRVEWSAEGEQRRREGSPVEVWLRLRASVRLGLQCQRCLSPVVETVECDRWLRFVSGAQQAESLDAESEDDVLELTRQLDLRELVEDELLLSLPIVPRHAVCPEPLELPSESPEAADPAPPHPFAVLQALKGPGRKH